MRFFQDLYKCIFVWSLKPSSEREIAKADAIVTSAHGLLKNGKPSPGDAVFTQTLRALHQKFPQKPIIPQEPVALAAPEIRYAAIARPPKDNILGASNMAWNSRVVAEFQADVCRKNGWKTVAVICHPYAPRFKWELERCGLRVLVTRVPPYNKKTYTHPQSISWYGRGGRLRYILIELLRGRVHYMSYYLGV